jgi:hypothetical protein
MDVSGQLHSPASVPPGKEPLVPIGWEADDDYVQLLIYMQFRETSNVLILFTGESVPRNKLGADENRSQRETEL